MQDRHLPAEPFPALLGATGLTCPSDLASKPAMQVVWVDRQALLPRQSFRRLAARREPFAYNGTSGANRVNEVRDAGEPREMVDLRQSKGKLGPAAPQPPVNNTRQGYALRSTLKPAGY